MDLKTAIQILGLKRHQSLKDLKAVFRELAHAHHPDKNPQNSSPEKFQSILEAYQFCLDHFVDLQDFLNSGDGHSQDEFSILFEENFAGFVHEPIDWQTVVLSQTECVPNTPIVRKLRVKRPCQNCENQYSQLMQLCRYCFGRKTIFDRRKNENIVCPRCAGRGRSFAQPCQKCDGFGFVYTLTPIVFELPEHFKDEGSYQVMGRRANEQSSDFFEFYLHIRVSHDTTFWQKVCLFFKKLRINSRSKK